MKATSVRTRLMLLDDHEFILHGISRILARHPDVEVISTHTESRTLLEALRIVPVDMVVRDYALSPGEVDGLNLIKAIRTRHPRTRVIVISSLHTPSTVALTLRCGAAGFVGKELGAEELLKAIRVVSNGRVYLHPDMEDALQRNNVAVHPLGPTEEVDEPVAALVNTTTLTLREREVLRCCLDGLSVTDISSKFSRSIKTISAQKQSAYRKLGLRTDHELFKLRALLERR